jgi:hypothetical protein
VLRAGSVAGGQVLEAVGVVLFAGEGELGGSRASVTADRAEGVVSVRRRDDATAVAEGRGVPEAVLEEVGGSG